MASGISLSNLPIFIELFKKDFKQCNDKFKNIVDSIIKLIRNYQSQKSEIKDDWSETHRDLLKNLKGFKSFNVEETFHNLFYYHKKLNEPMRLNYDLPKLIENTRLVKAKLSPNFPPAMDMIKATIKSGQGENNNDIVGHGFTVGKIKMVRWAAFNDIKDGPYCSWAPMGGRGAARNLSNLLYV